MRYFFQRICNRYLCDYQNDVKYIKNLIRQTHKLTSPNEEDTIMQLLETAEIEIKKIRRKIYHEIICDISRRESDVILKKAIEIYDNFVSSELQIQKAMEAKNDYNEFIGCLITSPDKNKIFDSI